MDSSDFIEDVKLNVLDQAWLKWKDLNVQAIYESLLFLIYVCVCVCVVLYKQKLLEAAGISSLSSMT